MLLEFFHNIVYFFTFWYRYFFWYKNYHIKSLTVNGEPKRFLCINYDSILVNNEDNKRVLVHYYFKNQEYIYLTHKNTFKWPPQRAKNGMIFNLPIKFASIIDEEGVEQFDVTEHIKKYAGPFNDFHEETIILKDIEKYFPKLKLVNILDQTVILDTETDSMHHQTLWSTSKISTHQD